MPGGGAGLSRSSGDQGLGVPPELLGCIAGETPSVALQSEVTTEYTKYTKTFPVSLTTNPL